MPGFPGFTAGGNIYPSRFVVASTSADFTVVQATDGSVNITGISQPGSRRATNAGIENAAFAAVAGEQLTVFQDTNSMVLLETGSATINPGDLLMPDANGRGVLATAGNFYGAVALEGCTATAQFIRVKVQPGELDS